MKTPRKNSPPPPESVEGGHAPASAPEHSAPTSPNEAPRWRSMSIQVTVVAAVAAVLYAALASWSDLGQVTAAMRAFPPRAGVVVGVLVLAGLALRAARWHYYTRVLELGVPVVPSVLAFAAGFAFTATPGKVGEVVKSFLLRRRFGARVSSTAGTLVVERVTDLLAVLLIAGVGWAYLGSGSAGSAPPVASAVGGVGAGAALEAADAGGLGSGGLQGGWVLAASGLALGLALAFLLHARLQRTVLAAIGRVKGARRLALALPPLLDSSRRLLTPIPLVSGLVLATAAWSCEALALHAILRALSVDVPPAGAFFAFAAATLLGVLSMLPGGLGGFEATMVVVLGELHVGRSEAVAATLLFRLGTLWLVSVLGLVVLAGWMVAWGRSTRQPIR